MPNPCLLGLPLLRKGDTLTDYYFWIRLSPALLRFYVKTGEAVEQLANVIDMEAENVRREGQQPYLVDPRIELMEGFGNLKVEEPMDHEVVILKRGWFGKKRQRLGIYDERETFVCAATDSNYTNLDALIAETQQEDGVKVAATALLIDVIPVENGTDITYRWDVEVVTRGTLKREKREVLYTLDISLDRLSTLSQTSQPMPQRTRLDQEELIQTNYVPERRARRVPPPPARNPRNQPRS